MPRYQYRHELDLDQQPHLKELDAETKDILEAAFALATKAHAGQSRDKIDPQWQYICHPLMVLDIMVKLGERDPGVLAAALLHDAIEDHSEYRANPETMCNELIALLYKQGFYTPKDDKPPHNGRAHQLVDEIKTLVDEITDPQIFEGEGIKENHQIDRVAHMSLAAKKIKIIDQAASLICNLTMANDPKEFPPEKEEKFAEKAYTLVRRIVESVENNLQEKTALKRYASLFEDAAQNVHELLYAKRLEQPGPNQKEEEGVRQERIREAFKLDELFGRKFYRMMGPSAASTQETYHPCNRTKGQGVNWLVFNEHGDVVRYALWVDTEVEGAANQIQRTLTAQIREKRIMGHQYMERGTVGVRPRLLPRPKSEQPRESHEDPIAHERVFDLEPPLNGFAFAAAAFEANAVDVDERESIKLHSKQLESDYNNRRYQRREEEKRGSPRSLSKMFD